MADLGSLYYTLGLRDLTDADLEKINKKLESAGATITVNPTLAKSINDLLPKGVDIEITPNKVAQEALDKAIEGKAMRAEVLPLVDKLKTAVADALRDAPVSLNGITIPPARITAAVSDALASSNFTSVGEKAGDELAKSIRVKVEGQTYNATVTAKTDKLTDTVSKALDKIFGKDQKIKLDRSDLKAFRDELKNKISEGIKVTPTLNITQEALQKAVEGKVMRVEIMPLVTSLRKNLKDAFATTPAEIEVGANVTTLRNTINKVLHAQGFMVNVETVTGLEKSIRTQLNGRVYNVKIRANATEIANSVQASLMQVQSRQFGLTVAKDVLRKSIDDALMSKPFNIQIAVMHDQARRAVQNALNNARMVGKDDALAYQRLQTGELKAAQAELARLKAAQQGAANAANTHASASINLGGALGSNIKIAGELGAAMASLYSIHAAKQFLSQVIEIGGELEHQKIALETIYGSGSKMETLYGQIKGLARQSPFGVMDLTKNVKQLSAYGVAYNEVYDTAKRLADISAATSVDISRLILAFGKTKNRTFLDGLEAKQFAYANIPIYDALSKKLTELEGKFVSVKDVMGRIKKREIGFDMVKDILWEMTDEGGKFYNMQEKLAGSVKTSWKLVRDNIELMFGEIAEGSVGSGLKSMAEILQKLTREWSTLGAAIGVGAMAFGVYKTAVLAHNVIAGQSIAVAAKQHASLKMARYHANLAALSYRALTQAEEENYLASSGLAKIKGINVLWSKKLTAAEADALVARKLLNREDVLRLVALRKLTAADAQYVLTTKGMTAADIQEMNAQIARAAAAKKSTVIWRQLWASMAGALATLRSFALTSLPLAAIGAVVALWQRNSEEVQRAKDISDGFFNKAVDSAKELKSLLETIGSSDALSNLELSQGIEQMESKIKDLSPTPIEDINNSLVAQDGHVRTLAERFEFLKGRLEQTAEAYNASVNKIDYANATGGALRATDGSNWFTKLFNDDLITNAKDYTEALKSQEDAIAKIISQKQKAMYSGINAALKSDAAFRKATEGIESYDEIFRFLIGHYEQYSAAVNAFDADTSRFDKVKKIEKIGNFEEIKDTYDELLADTDRFIANLNARLKLDPLTMTEEQRLSLTMSLKHVLDSMEGAGEDAKAIIAKKWEEAWNIVLIEDKIGPAMKAKFGKLMADSSEEGIETIRRKLVYEGFDSLDKEQQAKVKGIMEKAKGIVMNELSLTNQQMADYLASHPLQQIIQLVYTSSQDAPSELAKELVSKHGYPGLTNSTDRLVKQWTKSGKMYESRNSAKESLQAVYSELEAAKREGGEVQKRAQEAYDEVWAALEYLDWTDLETKDQKSNKHSSSKGSQKDTFAESLKQRFKDIKDAWSEFQKWSKTEGTEAAAERIGESGLFSTLPKEKIPKTVEQYRSLVKELEDELRKAGVKGNARESLLNDLLKQLLDIDKTVVDEQLKLALDKVSKEAERQIADWNLFDKIRKATGNQNLAMSVAFGMNATAETDYPAMVKRQFVDLAKELGHDLTFDNTTLEEARKLGDDIAKAYQDTASKLEKYAREQKDAIADILSEYQSLSDKLAKIDADRERKIKTVRKSDMPDADKAKYIQRINVEADYQKFTQSNEYLQFFGGIYALTIQQAQQIGDLIEENLNRKLQAGAISAEDYYKEIERVRQQLDKLRNVKSNALTFMTEGFKGLNKKQQEENDSKRLETIQKIKDLEEKVAEARAKVKGIDDTEGHGAVMQAEAQLKAAKKELEIQNAIRDKLIKNQEQMGNLLGVVNVIANIAGGMSDAFNTLRDMADSFGFDTDSNAWNTAASVMDTLTTVTGGVQKVLQSLMSGDLGGVFSGVFDTLLSPITIWNKLHDKKLDRMIEKSKEAAQIMQNQYDILEKRMANFLGNAALMRTGALGGGYGTQRELMQGQLAELEEQRQAEIDKKKTDDSVVRDYDQQIEEMKISIRDFAIEAANAVYGIDLNGWAEQLGDALVDAFAAGEDAAEAFDKTVGDIMRDVTSKMISQDILAPMFGDLRDYLFGKDGTGGAFGSDFQLDPSEMGAMKEYLDKIKNEGIPAAQELFDAINDATGGMLNDTEKSKDGMTKGLQSLTENTGDLLASYVNDGRASLSVIRTYLETYFNSSLPQMSIIAESQLQAQRQIAENTLRTAEAAEAINSAMSLVTKNQDRLERSWRRIAEKNWGTY